MNKHKYRVQPNLEKASTHSLKLFVLSSNCPVQRGQSVVAVFPSLPAVNPNSIGMPCRVDVLCGTVETLSASPAIDVAAKISARLIAGRRELSAPVVVASPRVSQSHLHDARRRRCWLRASRPFHLEFFWSYQARTGPPNYYTM